MRLLPLLSIVLLFASCSNKLSIQKRKYNKGYHIAFSHSPQGIRSGPKNNQYDPTVTVSAENIPQIKTPLSSISSVKEELHEATVLSNPTGQVRVRAGQEKLTEITYQPSIPLNLQAKSELHQNLKMKSSKSGFYGFFEVLESINAGIYIVSTLLTFVLIILFLTTLFSGLELVLAIAVVCAVYLLFFLIGSACGGF